MEQIRVLTVRKAWIELPDVSQGVRLQQISGAMFYYQYADREPDFRETGLVFQQDADGILDLIGGRIWVRSTNYSVIGYQPANISSNTPGALIGDLGQLDTANKTNVVEAINELNARLDLVGSQQFDIFMGDITITPEMITDKQLTLPFTPVPETVQLDVYGGIRQRRNVDFIVTGNTIAWDTLALELLLDPGSVISLQCFRG